jgi:hypothetical protein
MVADMKRRHPNLYHQVSKTAFDKAVSDLDARIPSLDRNEIIVGMMRIAALVGDGHTRISPLKDPAFQFPSVPLKLYSFDDGLWVRAVAPGYEKLLGARVVAVGGVPVDEAIRRVSELASRDNPMGPRFYAPIFLAMPDVLEAAGLSINRSEASLTFVRDGKKWTEKVPAGEVSPVWPPDTDISLVTPAGWPDARKAPQPVWLQAPLDYHRLIELPESSALYAQLNMIADTNHQSLADFGRQILAKAEAMNPHTVILDLRLAFGGNGDLRNGFIPSLVRLEDTDTRLIVLTARGTFSASQFVLDDLDRLTNAVIIGEPASSRPASYGDGYRSKLPNSGIAVQTSIKYWQSGQDMREWTPVDIAPGYRFDDYIAGRDPALQAALAVAPEQSLEDQLAAASLGGPDALSAVGANALYRYADFNGSGARVAQRLLASNKAAALRLARWTAARLPNSSDAATVLALVADRNGETVEARRSAERAIAIDPNNRSARSLLDRLPK